TDALRRESARERDRVSFRDADIEESVWPLLLEQMSARAGRHRRRDGNQLGVRRRQCRERVTENLGPGGRAARLLAGLAGFRIVRGEAVPLFAVGLREREP